MGEDISDVSPLVPSREDYYRVKAIDKDSRGGGDGHFHDDLEEQTEEQTEEEEEQKEEKGKSVKKEAPQKEAPPHDEARLLEGDHVILTTAPDVVPPTPAINGKADAASTDQTGEAALQDAKEAEQDEDSEGHVNLLA